MNSDSLKFESFLTVKFPGGIFHDSVTRYWSPFKSDIGLKKEDRNIKRMEKCKTKNTYYKNNMIGYPAGYKNSGL